MDEEISLPKSTIARAIKERLPPEVRVNAEAVDIIIRCCEELVHMIASESNSLSEKEKKSTIQPEHIVKSLESLGFAPYLPGINAAWEEWKVEDKESKKAVKERKAARSNTGMSAEEMLALQQKMFEEARKRTLAGPLPGVQQQQQPDAAGTSAAAAADAGVE